MTESVVRPPLVAFSGIDGSGKTTQARLLVRHLRGHGVDARYATAIGPNTRSLRLLKDQIAPRVLEREDALARGDPPSSDGDPSRPEASFASETSTTDQFAGEPSTTGPFNSKPSTTGGLDDEAPTTGGPGSETATTSPHDDEFAVTGPSRALGLGFLARGVWQAWATPMTERDGDVVVLDRYLHDDLVRVAWRYGFDDRRLARLSRFVPDPDLHIRLRAASATAWNRESDGRTTLEEHAAKNAWYDRLFDALPETDARIVSVDTEERSIEATHRRVLEAFEERVAPMRSDPP